MRRFVLAVLAVTEMGILVPAVAKPEDHGLPPGMKGDLTMLGEPLRDPRLTPIQRTDALVCWLVEERLHPSPPRQGLGGVIDTDWIQAQIILALWELGDPMTMKEIAVCLAETPPLPDPVVLDAVRIALGMVGDREQLPRIIEILKSHPEGRYRAMAARALGDLGATEARSALEDALTDPFAQDIGPSEGVSFPGRPRATVDYPVRREARGSLQRLSKPHVLARTQERAEAFARMWAMAAEDRALHEFAARIVDWIQARWSETSEAAGGSSEAADAAPIAPAQVHPQDTTGAGGPRRVALGWAMILVPALCVLAVVWIALHRRGTNAKPG